MIKILMISISLVLLPSASQAADENPMEQKTLLEKISNLQVFKLRLPYSLQRSIQKEREAQAAADPDSCDAQARPHQRGAEVDYSCNTHKALKKELSGSVAAN